MQDSLTVKNSILAVYTYYTLEIFRAILKDWIKSAIFREVRMTILASDSVKYVFQIIMSIITNELVTFASIELNLIKFPKKYFKK